MFPLHTASFPNSAAELTALLNESFTRLFSGVSKPVSIQEKNYPALARLTVTLDNATLVPNPPPPPKVSGASSPALSVGDFEIRASRISLGPATADLSLNARDLRLNQALDQGNEIVLVLENAAEGEVEISAAKSEIENAIAAVAKEEAGKQGVTIESVQLNLRERGPRSLSGEVQLRARKLFFTTVIRIAGDLDLDDDLNAKLSGVTCHGDGAIGAIACGVLRPHLQKVEGRSFPLMALPLGQIRLRDVRLSAGTRITVTAEFGA